MFELNLATKLVGVVTLAGVLSWQYWRWKNRRLLQLSSLLPGPPAIPLLGNALIFMANLEDLLGVISKMIRQHGEYMRLWLGPDLNVVVSNPADIRYLLTSNKLNQKGPCYKFMLPFIGPGILTGGITWRNHRKLANPSYNKRSVEHFGRVFNEEACQLARTLAMMDTGDMFDVYPHVLGATTLCVCQTLMGLSKKDSQNVARMDDVIHFTQSMYTLIFKKMTRWFYQIPPVYYFLGKRVEEGYIEVVDAMTSDILAKRRRALQESDIWTFEDANTDVMGVVDRFILSGELTDKEIKEETFSLFTTSQEASAKIASAMFLFLAHLPEWQEKVHKEIIEVLGPHDEPVTEGDLKRLVQLDLVYREVLRWLSIAAIIQRTVEEEVTIKNGEITLPVGTSVVIPLHELHRDPKYWDEPYKIKPERFLPENCKKRDRNAFIPFSLGPMDCLGRVYATALIKTLVVRVLRLVTFEAEGQLEDLKLHVAISVKFAYGYNLRARPRERRLSTDRVNA